MYFVCTPVNVRVCFRGFYKGTEMRTVFAIEMHGVIQRRGAEGSGGVDGTPPGCLDFQRAHLMNSQCSNARTTR